MSRNYSNAEAVKRERLINFAWIAGVVIMIIGLMVYQQTEILYVLSTVSVTVLLVIVAIADLHGKDSLTTSVNASALAAESQVVGEPSVRARRTPRSREV